MKRLHKQYNKVDLNTNQSFVVKCFDAKKIKQGERRAMRGKEDTGKWMSLCDIWKWVLTVKHECWGLSTHSRGGKELRKQWLKNYWRELCPFSLPVMKIVNRRNKISRQKQVPIIWPWTINCMCLLFFSWSMLTTNAPSNDYELIFLHI